MFRKLTKINRKNKIIPKLRISANFSDPDDLVSNASSMSDGQKEDAFVVFALDDVPKITEENNDHPCHYFKWTHNLCA